jgi:thiol-disulfide isomerase/thioredoxin
MAIQISKKPKIRRLTRLGVEALVFIAILAGVLAYQSRNLLPVDARPAPALSATTLTRGLFDLQAETAPTTLVYFFAPWCKICAASSSNINYLRRMRGEEELRVLMVALDWQSTDEVQDYVDRHNISVPVLLGDRKIASNWNIYAFPTYYVLDSKQRVVRRDLGYSTLAGLWWRSLVKN